MLYIKRSNIDAFDASQVHVDLIGVRARDIKRRHAASLAEMMLRRMGVETVSSEFLPGRQQPKSSARYYPVDVPLFRADGAIAFGNSAIDGPRDLVNDAPAMASAAVDPTALEFIRHRR
jgi:hypothetical protein